MIPETALATLFLLGSSGADTAPTVPAPAKNQTAELVPDGNPRMLAASIKTDLESIAGAGTVDVNFVNGRLFNVRVLVPSLRSDICNPIYDRELKLYRLFPELNFDFYLRVRR